MTDFPVPQNVQDYVDLLEAGTPFTHTNIGGDGEFLTITGWDGVNSDGHRSTPEKGDALGRVILEPRSTLHGYNPGRADSEKLGRAEAWMREHGVNIPNRGATFLEDPDFGSCEVNVRWVHKEIISSANVRGEFAPMLRILKDRALYVVASEDVTREFLGRLHAAHFRVPLRVGWEAMEDLEERIRGDLATLPPDTVVTWSLGYLAKVLQWRIAPGFPAVTQLDFGAIWDSYCGVHNRHGYKRPGWEEAKARNLQGLA